MVAARLVGLASLLVEVVVAAGAVITIVMLHLALIEKICRGLMYLNECLNCVEAGYISCFYCATPVCRRYCDVIREVGNRHCVNKPKDPLGGRECNNQCLDQCLGSCQSVSDTVGCTQRCFDQCCKPYAISYPSGAIAFTSPLNFVRLVIP
jgi:hypothetical protein